MTPPRCLGDAWFMSPPLPTIMEGLNLKVSQNFAVTKIFLTFVGDKPLWGELNDMGGVIFITTFPFHFFRNSQHPEKWSVSLKNFFRKCEYTRSCYLLISSSLPKKCFRKFSLFVLTVIGDLEESVLLTAYFKLLL